MAQVKSLQTGIKFKDTPIGKIPVDWEVTQLSQVADIIMGQSPSSEVCHDYKEGLPFYQGNADFGSKYPTTRRWCKKPLKIAQKGDVLISVRAPVGEINIAPYECCIGRGLSAIRATKINDQYLYQSMLFHRKALEKVSQGSTFEAINRKDLSEFLVFTPPLPEQKKIAEILTNVDDAIEETDRIIEKTKELKKGLMQRLLTRGIGHKNFKNTEIREIPENWDVVKIGGECDCIVPGRNKPKSFDGEIPWITIPDIMGPKIKKSKEGLCVSIDEIKKCGTRIVPSGSVIMSCVGEFGIVAITDREIIINQQLHAFIPPNDLDANFLRYALILQKPYMEKIATKTTIPYMNKVNCNSIPIPKPPINEQKEIINILLSLEDNDFMEQQFIKYLKELKKSLMQILLTGRVRVKLH